MRDPCVQQQDDETSRGRAIGRMDSRDGGLRSSPAMTSLDWLRASGLMRGVTATSGSLAHAGVKWSPVGGGGVSASRFAPRWASGSDPVTVDVEQA